MGLGWHWSHDALLQNEAALTCAKIGFGIDSRLPVFWGV